MSSASHRVGFVFKFVSAWCVVAVLASAMPAYAVSIVKDNNNTALNVGTSWVGGAAPTASDVMVFDNTLQLATNNLVLLGGDMPVQGIAVTTLTPANVNQAQNSLIIDNASSANLLTIGSAGIDMSGFTGTATANTGAPLQIRSNVALAANQTWNVSDVSSNITTPATGSGSAVSPFADNDHADLLFAAQAAITVNLGGFTVNKTGNGTVSFNGGHTVSNGVINVNAGTLRFGGGSSRAGVLDATTTVNVAPLAILRLQSNNTADTTLAGALNLADTSTVQITSSNNTNNRTLISGPVSVTGSVLLGPMTQPISGANNATSGRPSEISGAISGNANATLTLVNTNTNANSILVLSGNNSGFLGNVTMNGGAGNRIFRMATDTAGSAAATWTLGTGNTLQVGNPIGTAAGASVQLGTLNGAGTINNPAAATTSTVNIGSGTFSGTMVNGAGTLALNKIGNGTLILSGANTYTGTTQISQGILTIQSPGSLASPVTVGAGATLGGNGTVSGAVTVTGGIVSPGNSPGTLTVGSLILDSLSSLPFELDTPGVVGSGVNDLIAVTGNLTLDGTLNISPLAGFGAGTYRLFDYGGSLTDNTLVIGTAPAGFNYQIDTSVASQVNLNVTVVPEPTTLALATLAAFGAILFARRGGK